MLFSSALLMHQWLEVYVLITPPRLDWPPVLWNGRARQGSLVGTLGRCLCGSWNVLMALNYDLNYSEEKSRVVWHNKVIATRYLITTRSQFQIEWFKISLEFLKYLMLYSLWLYILQLKEYLELRVKPWTLIMN